MARVPQAGARLLVTQYGLCTFFLDDRDPPLFPHWLGIPGSQPIRRFTDTTWPSVAGLFNFKFLLTFLLFEVVMFLHWSDLTPWFSSSCSEESGCLHFTRLSVKLSYHCEPISTPHSFPLNNVTLQKQHFYSHNSPLFFFINCWFLQNFSLRCNLVDIFLFFTFFAFHPL